jgi:hypothetical protein
MTSERPFETSGSQLATERRGRTNPKQARVEMPPPPSHVRYTPVLRKPFGVDELQATLGEVLR